MTGWRSAAPEDQPLIVDSDKEVEFLEDSLGLIRLPPEVLEPIAELRRMAARVRRAEELLPYAGLVPVGHCRLSWASRLFRRSTSSDQSMPLNSGRSPSSSSVNSISACPLVAIVSSSVSSI